MNKDFVEWCAIILGFVALVALINTVLALVLVGVLQWGFGFELGFWPAFGLVFLAQVLSGMLRSRT